MNWTTQLFCVCLISFLVGCETPSIPTTSVAIRFVTEEGEPLKDVKATWSRRQASRKIDGDGPFTTDKKGQVIFPRATVRSTHRDRYEIRFHHPSYYPGSAYFSTDGILAVIHDDGSGSVREKPFLHGNYIIQLKRRGN